MSQDENNPTSPGGGAGAPGRARWTQYLLLVFLGYLFFLAIEFVGSGMKTSFADIL